MELEELREKLRAKKRELLKLESDVSELEYELQEMELDERRREREHQKARWEMDQFTARQAAYHRR